ncbi:SRPBCC domain-containing protein [Anaerobacillus alkaliphilus]|uniref:SRPBCC domain-containing protein n=1 Tax=Anaerobacillus alkaliphilus TaxID=1548597 RepID=A0A4Q0VXP8_9BACI|nr:SRPBCC domain-containing protein [Anaerobacillus alkaliphilus]RXJ04319.1 SRPBCC domain-containing protein [Anaerobacillus alkaliphilus]
MTTPDIRKVVLLNASIEKVWNSVATSEGISSWFMENDFKPEEGFEFTIHSPFGPTSCKVLKVEEPNHVGITWGEAGWEVSFDLKQVEDQTELTMVHSGWGAPDEKIQGPGPDMTNLQIRTTMDMGWDGLLNNGLRNAVEK